MNYDEQTMMPLVEAEFMHYGVARRSGRYPWGSGKDPYQAQKTFLANVRELREKGYSQKEIAEALGLETTTELRAGQRIAINAVRAADQTMAITLREKGMSHKAIGERLGGMGESQVRNLIKDYENGKIDRLSNTVNILKSSLDEKEYIQVGLGTETQLGISRTQLKTALKMMEEEGYLVRYVNVVTGPGRKTSIEVLTKPDVEYSELAKNLDKIELIGAKSPDMGQSFQIIKPPKQLDPDRLAIRYAEDGGTDADGVMYVRPGVADLALGGASYAQVRIAVGGTHYLKGMIVYKDDLPDGVDIMFNTNKSNTGNKLDALKPLDSDPDRPFKSVVAQRTYLDAKGKPQQSLLNIVNEEGDWRDWSNSLASQMLSKQPIGLAQQQLAIRLAQKKDEFDEIMRLTNPTVKKRLLESFSDDLDSAAVDLRAAALPRQATHVILPSTKVKETEIYAPSYQNGERVVLIRYPHGGKFEIPELVVNNKTLEAKRMIGNAPRDAVVIHPKVAEKLSGADFDGDTVLVIPNNKGTVKHSKTLDGLKDFDPKSQYKAYEGMVPMTKKQTQLEMGRISNLITDMTLKGATDSELARAVRHSMVVIDAEKHKLNYKQSEVDNGISQLKTDYQGKSTAGASTLISRASAEVYIPDRRAAWVSEGGAIDSKTGKKNYVPSGKTHQVATGKDPVTGKKTYDGTTAPDEIKVKRLSITDDAHSLSSGTAMERIYADHSNHMKALANEARKAMIATPNQKAQAISVTRATYGPELTSLSAKIEAARLNKPKERQAQLTASLIVKAKRAENPDMDDETLKKTKRQALQRARSMHGAEAQVIKITPREWEAIQAGALSHTRLSEILSKADLDEVKKYATPRDAPVMGTATLARARSMLASGATPAEVASALGVASSTLDSALHRES